MQSQAQRRYLWATHPDIARRWEDHTPAGAKLPERKGKKKAKQPAQKAAGDWLADLARRAAARSAR